MTYCLPKEQVERFIKALKEGRINPEKLSDLKSAERRKYFEDIVGPDDARSVNALFESKLLLKNQQQGMITWIKQVTGMKESVKRDILTKIEKMENVLSPSEEAMFLEDLAAKKLGTDITIEEAKQLVEFTKQIEESKSKIIDSMPNGAKERVEYGTKYALLQEYIQKLKEGETRNFTEWINSFKTSPKQTIKEVFQNISGTSKSILASLDNSFFGRQGIKVLYTTPSIWIKDFLKSWGDIGTELKGIDAMTPIKAEIYSRKNALNGKYEKMGLDIGIKAEEAFPSSLPEKIPLFGRLFKASETAFNGAALRMRVDLADRMIDLAERYGKDMTIRKEAQPIGELVNSLTGRGKGWFVPKSSGGQEFANVTFFSTKFLQGNINTVRLLFSEDKFVRKIAAQNLAKIIASFVAIQTTANLLQPGSAEQDTRSSNFGKIKVGKTIFDYSGGLGALVTLASRVTPTKHGDKGGFFGNGWGFWTKSAKTGKWTDLSEGKYGQQNVVDVIDSFWQGKLSPIAGILRDVWKGENFQGQKPTVESIIKDVTTPLPIQTFQDLLNNPDAAPLLGSMILDVLGFSTYTPPPSKKK